MFDIKLKCKAAPFSIDINPRSIEEEKLHEHLWGGGGSGQSDPRLLSTQFIRSA